MPAHAYADVHMIPPMTVPISGSCGSCGNPVELWVDRCRHCQADVGFPNVRAASDPEEVAALHERYSHACVGKTEPVKAALRALEEVVTTRSRAVLNRKPEAFESMLRSEDDITYQFYRQIDAGLRLPQSDDFNKVRVIADDIAFPGYKEEIRFASLVLDDIGLTSYGSCTLALRTPLICTRATVLDQNSLFFANDASRSGDLFSLLSLPMGHRATWAERGKLAVVKLAPVIESDPAVDPATALVGRSGSTEDDDFVEVHIWGSITAKGLEAVTFSPDASKRSDLYRKVAMERLAQLGIPFRVVPA